MLARSLWQVQQNVAGRAAFATVRTGKPRPLPYGPMRKIRTPRLAHVCSTIPFDEFTKLSISQKAVPKVSDRIFQVRKK